MKQNEIMVQRIPHYYVGEDCVQTMVSHKDNLTVLNKEGILYHYEPNSQYYINQYLNDERRKQFPYSSIPTHREKIGFSKYMVTNQLQNFEEPYIRVYNNLVIESFAIKDQEEALLIKKVMSGFKKKGYRTRQEIEEMFKKPINDDKKLYIFHPDGSIEQNLKLLSEQEMIDEIKEQYITQFQNYQEGTNLTYFGENQLKYFQYYLYNMSVENLPNITDDGYMKYPPLFLVKADENAFSIQIISMAFMKKDLYRVETVDMPITNYTLEQVKDIAATITKTKEPKISLRLNPTIKKEDLDKEKQKVKSLRK